MQESEARQREREAAEAAQLEVFDAWQAALPALLPHLGEERVSCKFGSAFSKQLLCLQLCDTHRSKRHLRTRQTQVAAGLCHPAAHTIASPNE